MEIFVELQTPSVELPVTAIDAARKKATILVGFRRYEAEESQKLYRQFLDTVQTAQEETQHSAEEAFEKVYQILAHEVLYIAKAKITVKTEEGPSTKDCEVDTRRLTGAAKTLFESEQEALDILLRKYLASAPWRQSLISAMFSALSNVSLGEQAEVKNW